MNLVRMIAEHHYQLGVDQAHCAQQCTFAPNVLSTLELEYFMTTFLRTFFSALRHEYCFEHFIDHFFELSRARAPFSVHF